MTAQGWNPDLNRSSGPKYNAIVEALAADIESGRLRAGDRLPPQRDLAWALKVNLSTVTQAYREATRRHLIAGEVGRGTYVLAESAEAALFGLKDHGPSEIIDLSTNVPAVDGSNRDLEETVSAMAADGGMAFGQAYHQPELVERARIAGADWLRERGLAVRPRDVVPCAGAQNALTAVLMHLCKQGDIVLVEELTFPGMKAVARQMGLRLHGVAIDHEGLDPDALEAACRQTGARVVVCVPTLQNPTATVMCEERRSAIADVARRFDVTVIEDDVYGVLAGVPPLSRKLPELGIVVTSLSKSVAAGLRFGMIAGRAPVVAEIAAEIHTTTWPMSPLTIDIARRWIIDGTAKRRTDWQRDEISRRQRIFARHFKTTGSTLSPHVAIDVTRPGSEVAEACRKAGVDVVAGRLFSVDRSDPQLVRLSLTASKSRSDLAAAIERLAELLA